MGRRWVIAVLLVSMVVSLATPVLGGAPDERELLRLEERTKKGEEARFTPERRWAVFSILALVLAAPVGFFVTYFILRYVVRLLIVPPGRALARVHPWLQRVYTLGVLAGVGLAAHLGSETWYPKVMDLYGYVQRLIQTAGGG